jgi:hypothetical protein
VVHSPEVHACSGAALLDVARTGCMEDLLAEAPLALASWVSFYGFRSTPAKERIGRE